MHEMFRNFREFLWESDEVPTRDLKLEPDIEPELSPLHKDDMNENFLYNMRYQEKIKIIKTYSYETAASMLKVIPQFSSNRIVKYLGKGAFSSTFLLDNDHVLKVGEISKGDKDWYSRVLDRVWSGTSTTDEIMVYDHGTIEETRFGWVEMSRVLPLDEYLDAVGVGYVPAFLFFSISRFFTFDGFFIPNGERKKKLSLSRELREKVEDGTILNELRDESTYTQEHIDYMQLTTPRAFIRALNKVPNEIIMDFATSLIKFIDRGEIPRDLHSGNIGVLYQNPSVMVFFDN